MGATEPSDRTTKPPANSLPKLGWHRLLLLVVTLAISALIWWRVWEYLTPPDDPTVEELVSSLVEPEKSFTPEELRTQKEERRLGVFQQDNTMMLEEAKTVHGFIHPYEIRSTIPLTFLSAQRLGPAILDFFAPQPGGSEILLFELIAESTRLQISRCGPWPGDCTVVTLIMLPPGPAMTTNVPQNFGPKAIPFGLDDVPWDDLDRAMVGALTYSPEDSLVKKLIIRAQLEEPAGVVLEVITAKGDEQTSVRFSADGELLSVAAVPRVEGPPETPPETP